MKKSIAAILFLFATVTLYAQNENNTGNFGESISKKGATSVKKLPAKMDDAESLDIKLKGTITEVCQAKGCWMTLDMGNDELLRVKFKDYGFFVPKDAAGKTAVIQGVASKETVSVDELRHLAEDAGKSEEEVKKITEPEDAFVYVAEGVIIQ